MTAKRSNPDDNWPFDIAMSIPFSAAATCLDDSSRANPKNDNLVSLSSEHRWPFHDLRATRLGLAVIP